MKKSGLAQLILLPVLLAAANFPGPPVTQKFLMLFQTLREAQDQPAATRRHITFALSGTEINEYMRYALHTTPRPGVDSVDVKIFQHNYVSTFTMVDFDAVERWRPGTIPAVLRPVLHGKQSIWVDFQFTAGDAKVAFSVEKAYYGTLRLPAFFVQKMIQMIAARQPEHYDTSKPVPLPFGLRQLWTENGVVKGNN